MSSEVVARAEALLEVDRPEDAIEVLGRALAADPDDTWLLSVLVRAQLDLDPEDAVRSAERLAGLEPWSSEAARLCAIVHDRLGHRTLAVTYAREAVAKAPNDPYAHSTLASVLGGGKKDGRHEALNAAKRAIQLAPDSTAGYFAAGLVELQAGNWKLSAVWFERVLEIDPHNQPAQINLAICNEATGRLADALGGMDGLLRFDPTDDHARSTLDGVVYTTLVHLLWIVLVLMYLVGWIRGVP